MSALVSPLKSLIEAVARQVKRGERRLGGSYGQFSEAVEAVAMEVERAAHAAALAALDVDAPRVVINGEAHERVGRQSRTYRTKAGPVDVVRSLFRRSGERRGPTVDTITLQTGAVGDGWLPDTAEAMAYLLQQGTSREAEQTARRLGRLPYSRSSFDDVGHRVGRSLVNRHQAIEQTLIESFAVPAGATGVTVSLDRVALPMEEPRPRPRGRPRAEAPKRPVACVYRMAFCATVTLHDKEGETLHTIRYGTMPNGDPNTLCVGLAGDVLALLDKDPKLAVSLLCDGAPEMWSRLDAEFTGDLFPKVSRLIDFFHVIEKLAPAARLLAVGDDAAQALLRSWRTRLKNTDLAAAAILRELEASGLEDRQAGDAKPVHEAITYLTNHRARLHYASALREGRPIGSGAVEATCKSLVAVRMKRPGARWKTPTGENILHLRAMALSDRWDDAMAILMPRSAVKIRVAA